VGELTVTVDQSRDAHWSLASVLGTAARLRGGRSGLRIAVRENFFLLENIGTGASAHQVSCSVSTGVLWRGGGGVKFTAFFFFT
jgi:hypothetical protein